MVNLGQMLKQLRGERSRTKKELSHLDDAIAAFEKLVGNNAGPAGARKLSRALEVTLRGSVSSTVAPARLDGDRWTALWILWN